ncbi:MAG: SGNH/GDSL hydrolase family protein [Fimbriiglobus sp.]
MPSSRFAAVAAALLALIPAAPAADPFAFQDGDRVVFLGSTLIEREQRYGYWELALTLKNRDKNVTFRNLGWSGDTVHGEARGRFDYQNAKKCFDEMVSLTTELKPTVIVICYGHNESFDGKPGVEKFTKGLEKLIDALAPTKARIVLMSPTPFGVARSLDNPGPQNGNLGEYCPVIKEVAERRKMGFVDLLVRFGRGPLSVTFYESNNLTDNGMHLTEYGYAATASHLSPLADGEEYPEKVSLPLPAAEERIRQKIIAKNQLFFHRWRPQNETYLLGFRKHEQGRNAVEIAQFDPLVAAAEKEIASLRSQGTSEK